MRYLLKRGSGNGWNRGLREILEPYLVLSTPRVAPNLTYCISTARVQPTALASIV